MSLQQFFPVLQPSARQQSYDTFASLLAAESNDYSKAATERFVRSLWAQRKMLYGVQHWGVTDHDDWSAMLWMEVRLWRALLIMQANLALVR